MTRCVTAEAVVPDCCGVRRSGRCAEERGLAHPLMQLDPQYRVIGAEARTAPPDAGTGLGAETLKGAGPDPVAEGLAEALDGVAISQADFEALEAKALAAPS
jgi:hypothetical protein